MSRAGAILDRLIFESRRPSLWIAGAERERSEHSLTVVTCREREVHGGGPHGVFGLRARWQRGAVDPSRLARGRTAVGDQCGRHSDSGRSSLAATLVLFILATDFCRHRRESLSWSVSTGGVAGAAKTTGRPATFASLPLALDLKPAQHLWKKHGENRASGTVFVGSIT
jgi:hypothetical protein